MIKTITIIGGGVIGCAIAYEISKKSGSEIYVLERNLRINAENQSSRNSGVIHAGIYYPKSKLPLKARLCVEGNKLLYDFCQEHNVPHKRTGKLVVATNSLEEEYIDDILKTALDNGILDARKLTGEEAMHMEPNVKSISAAYLPSTGIIEPAVFVRTLQRLAEGNGVFFVTGNKVVHISPYNKFQVTTESNNQTETIETDIVINAAGLYSDEIAKMVNPDSPYEIDPVRGESAKFYDAKTQLSMNGMNVYPAPYGYYTDTGKTAEVSFSEYQKLLQEKKVKKKPGKHKTAFQSFTLKLQKPVDRKRFEEFLKNLPKEVYRLKGFVPFTDGKTCLLSYVAGRFDFEEMEGQHELVFIGENLFNHKEGIRNSLPK